MSDSQHIVLLAERLRALTLRLPYGTPERAVASGAESALRALLDEFETQRYVCANNTLSYEYSKGSVYGRSHATNDIERTVGRRAKWTLEEAAVFDPKPAPLELAPEVTP